MKGKGGQIVMGKQALHVNDSIFPRENIYLANSFNLQEEEKLFSKTIEKFVNDQVLPNRTALDDHNYPVSSKLFREAGDLGLLGVDVPEDYGGLELGKRFSGLVAEKMGYGGSFSVSFNIHTGVGTLPYVYFGTEQQKVRYLPKLISGEWVGAYALTEPNAGSDAFATKSQANWDADSNEWIINGAKQWITNAHIAGVYVVFANTSEGITAFIVERSLRGVSIGPEEKKLGIKGSSTATLILEDVRVSNEQVLGEIGKGHYIAITILNLARLKLSFANIGTSKQALSLAINYGLERKQFQKEIIHFPMIQEKLANMAIAIFGAESAAYYTASLLDQMNETSEKVDDTIQQLSNYALDCSVNKVYASEALDAIVDEALQIHGGYGYMQEYDVEYLYRDARINRIFEGTNEINRLTITKSFFKKFNKDQITAIDEITSGTDNTFQTAAMKLFNTILKAVSISGDVKDLEQESMRIIADVLKEIYVIKAAKLTAKHAEENNELKELLADILSEEGYRRVEQHTIELIASIVSDKVQKQDLLEGIKALNIPLYSNLFAKKRKIAAELTKQGGYSI